MDGRQIWCFAWAYSDSLGIAASDVLFRPDQSISKQGVFVARFLCYQPLQALSNRLSPFPAIVSIVPR